MSWDGEQSSGIKALQEALFPAFTDRRNNGQCPFCSRTIDIGAFNDVLSLKEYHISGLCQACQDEMFEGQEEEEEEEDGLELR